MAISNTAFLRTVLLADGVVSGLAGLVMAAGAPLLAPLLGLPQPLLLWAGLVLLPWCAALVYFSRRETTPRLALIDIVGINVLWVAASFGIMLTGAVQPNALGIAFVTAQALAVGLFAALQISVLRRTGSATA